MSEHFGTQEALDEIEDAMVKLNSPYNAGVAMGMIGAYYQAGLITHGQFNTFTARVIEAKIK